MIVGASTVRNKQIGEYLRQLNIPIFTTASAKGIVDETLDCSAGVYTGVGLEKTPEFVRIQN